MREQTAVMPLKELSTTQLIAVINRLQDKIDALYRKSDAEIRRENEQLHKSVWAQGALLEGFAEILIANGYKETEDQAMLLSLRKIIQRMYEAERKSS